MSEVSPTENSFSSSPEAKMESAIQELSESPLKGEDGFKEFLKSKGASLGISLTGLLFLSGFVVLKITELFIRCTKGIIEEPENPGKWIMEIIETFKIKKEKDQK